MKSRILLTLPLLLVLGACANVKSVRDREPAFFGSTQKTADEYTTCVAQGWKGLDVPFERKAVHNGYELVVPGSLGVDAVLTTTTWKNKTEARLSTRVHRRDQSLAEAANLCL